MKIKTINVDSNSIHRRLLTPSIKEENGYALTSKLGKVDEITQNDRITLEMATNPQAPGYIGPGTCISSTDKGSRFLILPVYETMETPPNEEKYQIRYIEFTR